MTDLKKSVYHFVLEKLELAVAQRGLKIQYTQSLDPFFKGDLDGENIYISRNLEDEEKLFNLLHLAGHCVQWNIDPLLRSMGSELVVHPDDELLLKLQEYEWQANCFALYLLHECGFKRLGKWLTKKYVLDMMYLTHFYRTGQKLKRVTADAKAYPFRRELEPLAIPPFTPKASPRTRNGIVIAF